MSGEQVDSLLLNRQFRSGAGRLRYVRLFRTRPRRTVDFLRPVWTGIFFFYLVNNMEIFLLTSLCFAVLPPVLRQRQSDESDSAKRMALPRLVILCINSIICDLLLTVGNFFVLRQHGLRRMWRASRRSPFVVVRRMRHLVPHLLHGTATRLRPPRKLYVLLLFMILLLTNCYRTL